MKRLLLLTMILLLTVSLVIPDIYAATTSQQKSATTTNLSKIDNTTINTSTIKNQSKTVPNTPVNGTVNNTVTNQSVKKPNVKASSANNNDTHNVNNKSTDSIQYAKEAAGSNANSNVQGNWFTTKNLTEASGQVKAYIETNHALPKHVQIGNIQVSMPQFLELITTDLVQLNKGNNTPVKLGSVNTPINSTGNINNGTLNKSEYLNLASKIQNFMDSTGRAPNYATSTLGKIRYESLIYMYSRIMNYYGINNVLPNHAAIKPLSSNNTTVNPSGNSTTNGYTIAQIAAAAGSVKNFIEKNQRLPKYVQINKEELTLPQFLELLNNGLLQVKGNNNTLVALKNAGNPSNPSEDLESGNINKSEYLNLASKIQNFVDSTGRAPNYATSTLGKIQYESLIYLESRIMNYYGVNKILPNYAIVNPWNDSNGTTSTIPDSLKQYLQPTANAQSNDPTIKSLAASITNGLSTPYSKANAIFNWVRDHVTYSYYYNTKYGALGTISSGTANCVDHSHLVVALARAAGIPARYEQGYCEFSDGWYGHVWAQLYVNGKWYYADTISSRNTFGAINNWNTSNWTYEGTYAELPF